MDAGKAAIVAIVAFLLLMAASWWQDQRCQAKGGECAWSRGICICIKPGSRIE